MIFFLRNKIDFHIIENKVGDTIRVLSANKSKFKCKFSLYIIIHC